MRRRDFLQTLSGSLCAMGATPPFGGHSITTPQPIPASLAEVPAVRPGDDEAYFTEEKLKQAIDTAVPVTAMKFEVVAYNFPGWHPTPFMEEKFGKGWTEFETLKNSKPLYPGHLFPKYPLWGYVNEAAPEWAEREISAAADSGIDVWMIDWYRYRGTRFLHEQLESGFLKARNKGRLKFALMWTDEDRATLQGTDEDFMLRLTDYCIEHYFHEPNYWRIDGRLVIGIFNVNLLLEFLSAEKLKQLFEEMRTRVDRAGLGDLHIQASHDEGYIGRESELKSLGFDSATSYHSFNWSWRAGRAPGSRSPSGDAASHTIRLWKDIAAKLKVPFYPDCPVGWDDSPRLGARAAMLAQRTSDQYERLLRAAKYLSAASSANQKIIFLSSWNEWTEDHVLLPDTVFGCGYLDAVRRAFRS